MVTETAARSPRSAGSPAASCWRSHPAPYGHSDAGSDDHAVVRARLVEVGRLDRRVRRVGRRGEALSPEISTDGAAELDGVIGVTERAADDVEAIDDRVLDHAL